MTGLCRTVLYLRRLPTSRQGRSATCREPDRCRSRRVHRRTRAAAEPARCLRCALGPLHRLRMGLLKYLVMLKTSAIGIMQRFEPL